MKRATLIVNPRAGPRRNLEELLPAMIFALDRYGIAGQAIETTGPGSASELAASAVADDADVVFACGGDGTVHEVLQGVVGTRASLGVIPLGAANALARNLGLSRDPMEALFQQINAPAVQISVGEVLQGATGREEAVRRYFTVMAGAGPDGALVYSLLSSHKSTLGRTAYYAHAARLFVTQTFHPFIIRYRTSMSGKWHEDLAVSAMCARIGDLGGVFGRLTRGSSLHSKSLQLSFLRPPGRVSLPSWFVSGQLGIHQINPWLRALDVEEFRCEPLVGKSVHAQVDGEWLGGIPISVRLVADALSLLVPRDGLSVDVR